MPGHAVIYVGAAISASQSAGDTFLDAERLALHVHSGVLGSQRRGLADITLEAVTAIGRHAGQHLNRRPFVAFAVRAPVLAES
ncbi:hypothetical protein D3C81_1784490 [compost metagenome]